MPTQATVTGNLQTLSGNALRQGQLTFELINITPGQMPQVSGTSILPVLRQVVQTAPDGSFTTQLWGNDNIVPPVTFYNVTLSDGLGTYLGPLPYSITGASVNLNSAIPTGGNVIPGAYTFSGLITLSGGAVISQPISGNAIPTITLKKGTGGGNYTSTSTSYVDVDATNLAYTITIPTGWKLSIVATGSVLQNTAITSVFLSLFDSVTLTEQEIFPPVIGQAVAYGLSWVINGDGASHTVKLQVKTQNAADAVVIVNNSASFMPTMVFTLSPSN